MAEIKEMKFPMIQIPSFFFMSFINRLVFEGRRLLLSNLLRDVQINLTQQFILFTETIIILWNFLGHFFPNIFLFICCQMIAGNQSEFPRSTCASVIRVRR